MQNKQFLKKLIFIILFSLALNAFAIEKDECKINIVAKNYGEDKMSVVYMENGKVVRHEVEITNGKGNLTIKSNSAVFAKLLNFDSKHSIVIPSGGYAPADAVDFFLEYGKEVTISFDNDQWPFAEVKGNQLNSDYSLLTQKLNPLRFEKRELLKKKLTSQLTEAEEKRQKEVVSKITSETISFISENPKSFASLYLLDANKSTFTLNTLEKLYNELQSYWGKSTYGKEINDKIEISKKATIGQRAPNFNKKEKNGKIVKGSDYLGNYLLIDFWGTWCGPCRKSHPHLVELYKKYSGKGLTFINVADEGTLDKTKWLKAIEEDRLTWIQILNDEGKAECNMVKEFNITAFPTKILIDPKGVIIGIYVGDGDEIDNDLIKIFNK